MRGRECETNKGVEIEVQLAGQNKRFGGAEPGGFGKLAAVIRRRVRPLGTVPAHELDQRGDDRGALPVANILDDRENTVNDQLACQGDDAPRGPPPVVRESPGAKRAPLTSAIIA
jgi:hypothetical protein